jgi:hypothetical protein
MKISLSSHDSPAGLSCGCYHLSIWATERGGRECTQSRGLNCVFLNAQRVKASLCILCTEVKGCRRCKVGLVKFRSAGTVRKPHVQERKVVSRYVRRRNEQELQENVSKGFNILWSSQEGLFSHTVLT